MKAKVSPCHGNCAFNIRAGFVTLLRQGCGGASVRSRGNRRAAIILDDAERQDFRKTLTGCPDLPERYVEHIEKTR